MCSHYKVKVLAVRPRGAEDIVEVVQVKQLALSTGDVVLSLSSEENVKVLQDNKDFFLVSTVGNVEPPPRPWDYVPLVMFLGMLLLAATEVQDMIKISFTVAVALIVGGWITAEEAFNAIDWR